MKLSLRLDSQEKFQTISNMHCFFCQRNLKEIDFKDSQTLKRFTSASEKIRSRKKTGLCAQHQKKLAGAIKRARFLALLPYIKK